MSGRSRMASGAVEYIKGKLQLIIGRMTGNKGTKAKGMTSEIKGGVKYETGKAEKNIDNTFQK